MSLSMDPAPVFEEYSHIRDFPRNEDALRLLKRLASAVKPIMKARGWKVKLLAEFYPLQPNLLGVNWEQGREINLRLRYPDKREEFQPFEFILDTLLHELAHIVHGPHDDDFHALWDQLRGEMVILDKYGYVDEASGGSLRRSLQRSGQSITPESIRSISRSLAGNSRSRSRLESYCSMERGSRVEQGCASTLIRSQRDLQRIVGPTRTTVRIRAQRDSAGEIDFFEAVWELVQEDMRRFSGNSYSPPSIRNPFGYGGGSIFRSGLSQFGDSAAGSVMPPRSRRDSPMLLRSRPDSTLPSRSRPESTMMTSRSRPDSTMTSRSRPRSTLASMSRLTDAMDSLTLTRSRLDSPRASSGMPSRSRLSSIMSPSEYPSSSRGSTRPRPSTLEDYWPCPLCTLHNTGAKCEACGYSLI